MGGLSSALSAISTVASVAQPFYQDSLNRKQQKAANELQLRQNSLAAANQKELLQAQDMATETDRRTRLKRAVANQRAKFGASGIGSGDGSSEAVLFGLFDESDEERALREKTLSLRNNAIDLNSAQIQQKNLLEQAQLRQKQDLARLTDIF